MAGLWVGKLKRMVADVKSNIDEELRMEELNALKQTGEKLKNDLASTQKELRDAGTAFQSSIDEVSDAAESATKEADVDIVSAINESAPKLDEELVNAGSSGDTKPAKSKASKKAKKKNAKKKRTADNKKAAKQKSTAKTSSKNGKTAKKSKKIAPAPEGKAYEAPVQAASNPDSDRLNQDPPDHTV